MHFLITRHGIAMTGFSCSFARDNIDIMETTFQPYSAKSLSSIVCFLQSSRRKSFCIVGLLTLCLLLSQSVSQAQWPPVLLTPSRALQHLRLPNHRFVPSTRRWNLVWADQIVPGNFTQGKLVFAAEHYVATQKIFASQAAQFRAISPNFLVIAYHLAAGLNPLHNDDCPDPKNNKGAGFIGIIGPKGYVSEYQEYFRPWLALNNITEGDARFEAMFQHYDATDLAHRVWHGDPAWLMNMANVDWKKYLGDVTLDWMNGNSNEGVFFDVAVETNSSLYNPKSGDPAPVNFDWWAPPHGPSGEASQTQDRSAFSNWMNRRYLGCYQEIYKRFHTGVDYLVIPNTDQMVTTVYDPLWTDGDSLGETIDGAMMESFGSYHGQDMWLTLERGVRHITGRGKILIAQFYGVDSTERLRRTAMYMLIKNENSFLNIINDDGVEWYPEYEIDLGDQSPLPHSLDSLRIAGQTWQSVWARDYAHGRVLCNTSDAAMQVAVPTVGKWAQIITHGGGKVLDDGTALPQSVSSLPVTGTITIPASGGVILLRQDTAAFVTNTPELVGATLKINPNPTYGSTYIHITNDTRSVVDVSIIDMLGKEVAHVFSGELDAGEHSFRWDSKELSAGMYVCNLLIQGRTDRVPMILAR